ncbi:hypothetical protein FRB99_007008 [Tulasnella sp. 403]|nr:hypothetical protein FRB99_007008 [Tulasnella sp. 403]
MSVSCITLPLNTGWQYKKRSEDVVDLTEELTGGLSWSDASSFPSEIHEELCRAGVIRHPHDCDSDTEFQWIGGTEWLYKTEFTLPHDGSRRAELLFEGLDTICDVYLNGQNVLHANDMLLPYTVELSPERYQQRNTLLLHFKSAKNVAKQLESQFGARRAGSCNLGDPSRVYVRKAQYHWRWDWGTFITHEEVALPDPSEGPEIMTVGPWRPIELRVYTTRIEELLVVANADANLVPTLRVVVKLKGDTSVAHSINVTIRDSSGAIVKQETRILSPSERSTAEASFIWNFAKGDIELWWPINYGPQSLYTVDLSILDTNGAPCDRASRRVGFRRVRLLQEPLDDVEGTSFLFEINNVPIFMAGSNWIPCHTILPSVREDSYRRWLEIALKGNHNMVRVWSGGVYEPAVFYDTCDELGLLVWQDFCGFACGVYPAHKEFIELVTAEAKANVKHLSHHPSIIVWCGNNEDYQQIMQWGEKAELPARVFYEEIFPDIVARLSPGVPYWCGSPYGGKSWYDTDDLTVGDIHEWHVWCNTSPGEYYQNYDILGGRFVSEFGLPSFPCMSTVNGWLKEIDASQRYPQSKVVAQHCRAGSFERRFATYMNENFRMTDNLEKYVFLTQAMQAEGLSWAYRSWRRQWKGDRKQYIAGALVWQLNDSWPVVSWSLVDYFFRKKPAYFAIARELRLVGIGLMRTVEKNRANDRPRQFYEFGAFRNKSATIEAWATNFSLRTVEAKFELSFYDLEANAVYHSISQVVKLLPNQSTEILKEVVTPPPPLKGKVPNPIPSVASQQPELDRTHTVVIHARLLDIETGVVLARSSNWPEPFKYLDFPDPQMQVEVEGDALVVQVKKPAKCVFFTVEGDAHPEDVEWSDNCVDLFPGDAQTLSARGLGSRKVLMARLGQEEATPLP